MNVNKKITVLKKRIIADVDPINHKDLKIAAAQAGVTMKKIVENALEYYAAKTRKQKEENDCR